MVVLLKGGEDLDFKLDIEISDVSASAVESIHNQGGSVNYY